jgi:hypothetical protein
MDEKAIAGAIFDFAGFLTGRDEEIKLGGQNDCGHMIEEIRQWAKLRGLNLDEADVQGWNR